MKRLLTHIRYRLILWLLRPDDFTDKYISQQLTYGRIERLALILLPDGKRSGFYKIHRGALNGTK